MSQYRNLYKENNAALNPRQYNKITRDRLQQSRAQQRTDKFNSNRQNLVSPIRKGVPTTSTPLPVKNAISSYQYDDKENNEIQTNTKPLAPEKSPSVSRIAKAACDSLRNDKLSRREAYLKKFMEYRMNKKKELKNINEKRKIPIAAGVNKNPAIYSKLVTQQKTTQASNQEDVHKLQESEDMTTNCITRRSIYEPKLTPKKQKLQPNNLGKTTANKVTQNALIGPNSKALPKSYAAPGPSSSAKASNIVTIKSNLPATMLPQQSTGNLVPKNACSSLGTKPLVSTNAVSNLPKSKCVFGKTSKPVATVIPSTKQGPQTVDKPVPQPLQKQTNVRPDTMLPVAKPSALKAVSTGEKPLKNFRNQSFLQTKSSYTRPIKLKSTVEVASTACSGGAVGKMKQTQIRRVNSHVTNSHKNSNLSTIMKAKKPTSKIAPSAVGAPFKRPPSSTRSNTEKQKKMLAPKTGHLPIAETPTDLNTVNPFQHFVTSTKLKSDTEAEFVLNEISPVETVSNNNLVRKKRTLSADSLAKRELLPAATENVTKQETDKKQTKDLGTRRKYNFVRYSEVTLDTDTLKSTQSRTPSPEVTIVEQKENQLVNSNEINENDNTLIDLEDALSTPKQQEHAERPANYLSPYVSVSRGKVSSREERERRNSIYLQNDNPKCVADGDGELKSSSMPQTPVAVRRTLEGVRYFRQQLVDETERLRAQCRQWQLYKDENLERLQELHCEDKIDAAIGQTSLLTGSKFEQFNSLIKRCEACATGTGAPQDGSEDTKTVTAKDLEGFWEMLRLQCDNVDKRFAEIERWKANDWLDPDAVLENPKSKNSRLTKVKKTKSTVAGGGKIKASSGLQELMRKKYAELRKQKTIVNTSITNTDNNSSGTESTTSLRQSKGLSQGVNSNGSQGRVSVIIPNRKRFSQAATVVNIIASPKSSKRRSSLNRWSPRSSYSQATAAPGQSLLKSAILGAAGKSNSPEAVSFESPKPRKSILKTPGTLKAQRKSVIFSAKKHIRKFKFTFEEKMDDNLEESLVGAEHQEDAEADMTPSSNSNSTDSLKDKTQSPADGKRAYGLRSRRIVLRPSCEIMIPRESNFEF